MKYLDVGYVVIAVVLIIAAAITICEVNYYSHPHVERTCIKGHDMAMNQFICDNWQDQVVGK